MCVVGQTKSYSLTDKLTDVMQLYIYSCLPNLEELRGLNHTDQEVFNSVLNIKVKLNINENSC